MKFKQIQNFMMEIKICQSNSKNKQKHLFLQKNIQVESSILGDSTFQYFMTLTSQYYIMIESLRKISRLGWTKDEEELLQQLYDSSGSKNWNQIAQKINYHLPGRRRTAKQCRERYSNYVMCNGRPINQTEWEVNQQKTLFKKYMQLGSKWVQISKYIPGRQSNIKNRPQNCIKNRFYGSLRKFVRNINKIIINSSQNKHRQLKYQTIINILEERTFNQGSNLSKINDYNFNAFVDSIKQQIISLITEHQLKIQQTNAINLLKNIQIYSLKSKSSLLSKIRKGKNLKRKSLPPIKNIVNGRKDSQGGEQNVYKSDLQSFGQLQRTEIQQQRIQTKKIQLKNEQNEIICLIDQLFPNKNGRTDENLEQFMEANYQNDILPGLGWF